MKLNHYSKIAALCSVCLSLLIPHMVSASHQEGKPAFPDEKDASKAALQHNLSPESAKLLDEIVDLTDAMGCVDGFCPCTDSLNVEKSVDAALKKVNDNNQ